MQLVIIFLLLWIICGLSVIYVDVIKSEPKESRTTLISQLLAGLLVGPIVLISVLIDKPKGK